LLNTGQLDTVVLLLVDAIGSIVISLSRCCLPKDEEPAPQIFLPRTAPAAVLVVSDAANVTSTVLYPLRDRDSSELTAEESSRAMN